jgi:hypothetical protein
VRPWSKVDQSTHSKHDTAAVSGQRHLPGRAVWLGPKRDSAAPYSSPYSLYQVRRSLAGRPTWLTSCGHCQSGVT